MNKIQDGVVTKNDKKNFGWRNGKTNEIWSVNKNGEGSCAKGKFSSWGAETKRKGRYLCIEVEYFVREVNHDERK